MKLIKRLLALTASLLFGLVLLELLCTVWAARTRGTIDVVALNEKESGDVQIPAGRIQPHPYFGFTLSAAVEDRNNIGTAGRDFPIRKDESKFTVLVVGGSVASALSRNKFLERALGQYDLGKPVIVLSGAVPAWQQPQSLFLLANYGDVADAVISVEGFNEHIRLQGGSKRLEFPNAAFLEVNPVVSNGLDVCGRAWLSGVLRDFSSSHKSRALYFVTKAARSRLNYSTEPPRIIQELYELPAGTTAETSIAFNLDQYSKYMRLMHCTAECLGLKDAYFIQPCPAIGKRLTAAEVAAAGDLNYAATYERMTEQLVALNAVGVPVVSITDVFNETTETVYVDKIHCGQQTAGYRLMAERIAAELAKRWNLRPLK